MRTQTLVVWVQLLLGWNTYLLFSTDIVNFVWKTNEGEAKGIVSLIFLSFGGAWIVNGWGVGAAEPVSFSSREFSRNNKHDIFWHAVTTGYFNVLFLWTIPFQVFFLLEIYKNFVFLLPSITFTVNSHADNHFWRR